MTISHLNRLRSIYLQKVCAPTQLHSNHMISIQLLGLSASTDWGAWVWDVRLYKHSKMYLSPWLNVEILDVHANHAWKQFFLSLLLQALYADPWRPSTHKCGSNECYLDSKSSHLTKVAWLKSFQPLHGPTSLSELPDNKGLAPTYLSLSYTCSYWKNAYYTHKCSFTRPYLPGLHILESLLAIDRPGIIQIA